MLTISTDAVTRADEILDEYLSEGTVTGEAGNGRVVAVVGEYGTGKTHIAITMLYRLAASNGANGLYLDAPGDSFLALYRERFIPRLGRHAVRRMISDYYADIVADHLEESELTRPLAHELRSREVDPVALVRNVGLMESMYRDLLSERLSVVSEDPSFGAALSLFLRPEFEAAVWEWLRGESPDPALVERGVITSIDDDSTALQAMGVIALLYGGQHSRFVVIFDEMEKILGAAVPSIPSEGILAAFKRMVEIFSNTGALLILCGLPDFLEALPEDSRQRISIVIKPSRLSAEDAIGFIEECNERSNGERSLRPFSRNVAAYLADLAGGNARRLVRLCFYAYEDAARSGTDVTRAIVREVAREQFELVSQDDLRRDVVRVLNRNGLRFEIDWKPARQASQRMVDFWIPISDGGCAIFLTQSVLQQSDVTSLEKYTVPTAERVGSDRLERILIINGFLGDDLRSRLDGLFDSLVVHNLRTFGEDLEATLQGAIARLEDVTHTASLAAITDKLDQTIRQNSQLSQALDLLARQQVGADDLQYAVEIGLTTVFTSIGAGGRHSSQFPTLDRLFHGITRRIDRLLANRHSVFLQESLYPAQKVIPVATSLAGARWLVQAFQNAVTDRLSAEGEDYIGDLCERYDLLIDDLVQQMRQTGTLQNETTDLSRELSSLGRAVYEATIRMRRD